MTCRSRAELDEFLDRSGLEPSGSDIVDMLRLIWRGGANIDRVARRADASADPVEYLLGTTATYAGDLRRKPPQGPAKILDFSL